jgi:hypothetical protein
MSATEPLASSPAPQLLPSPVLSACIECHRSLDDTQFYSNACYSSRSSRCRSCYVNKVVQRRQRNLASDYHWRILERFRTRIRRRRRQRRHASNHASYRRTVVLTLPGDITTTTKVSLNVHDVRFLMSFWKNASALSNDNRDPASLVLLIWRPHCREPASNISTAAAIKPYHLIPVTKQEARLLTHNDYYTYTTTTPTTLAAGDSLATLLATLFEQNQWRLDVDDRLQQFRELYMQHVE